MAKLRPTLIKFKASTSTDVVSNALYVRKASDGAVNEAEASGDYVAKRFVLPNTPDAAGDCNCDLAAIEGFPTEDANYNIGIAAIDDFGNESSMVVLNDVPLDFAAPNPITNLMLI